jgi:ribulose 1,5-bisphosphate carboxylase large subunit-like protein
MTISEILERVTKGRRKRAYPRVIKKYKGRTYPVKQAGQTGGQHDPVIEIRYPLTALLN